MREFHNMLYKCKKLLYGNFIYKDLNCFNGFLFDLSLSICPGMMQPERHIQNFDSKSRGNSFTYDVKRDVYNEETFQQEHRRKSTSSGNVDIDITTVRHRVQCRFVCVATYLQLCWQNHNPT